MPDFSGLPLVIESADLLGRLDSKHLILVDLTSIARYAEGHIPARISLTPSAPNWDSHRHPACYQARPTWKNCSANWATPRTPPMWSTTTKAAVGPGVLSGCST